MRHWSLTPLFSLKYPQVPSDVATDLQVWWSSQKENDFGREKKFTFQMILQKVKTQVSLKINFQKLKIKNTIFNKLHSKNVVSRNFTHN